MSTTMPRTFHCLLKAKIEPAILKSDGTWIHYDRLSFYDLNIRVPSRRLPDRWVRNLMHDSLPIIQLIWKDARRFTNTVWCPNTAIGEYIWSFQVEMVQQLIWLSREFIQGFAYGKALCRRRFTPGEPARDANPYHDHHRHVAWDAGYILSLEYSYHPERFRQWRQWLNQL